MTSYYHLLSFITDCQTRNPLYFSLIFNLYQIPYFLHTNKIYYKLYKYVNDTHKDKVEVGFFYPIQQPGSYWDRPTQLPPMGLEPRGDSL